MIQESDEERLFDAVRDGDIDTIRAFFSSAQPPDVNHKHRWVGFSLLHAACQTGHLDVVEYLVEEGADVTIEDEQGDLPIHSACGRWNKDYGLAMVRVLHNKNHEIIHAKGAGGWTCLHLAVEAGNGELVRWLLDNEVDPRIEVAGGRTAWDLAIIESPIERFGAFSEFVLKEEIDDPWELDCLVRKLGQQGATHVYLCESNNVSAEPRNSEDAFHILTYTRQRRAIYVQRIQAQEVVDSHH